MDLSNPVLSGLIRKRQELAAELDATQATLRRVVASLDAIDATIRLSSPDLDLDAARVRPARRVDNPQHETTRQVLGVLREADGALSYRDIALRMMHAAGANVGNAGQVGVMRRRAAACVRRLVRQGTAVEGETARGVLQWKLSSSLRSTLVFHLFRAYDSQWAAGFLLEGNRAGRRIADQVWIRWPYQEAFASPS